ncbi:hydrophobic protein [Streptomyces sp. NBC_00047]|nr:hydrophobic protein [Streptomyces sp. NBC_00047]
MHVLSAVGHTVLRRLITMVPLLLVLLLVLLLFGAGFAVKILWWVAIAVLVLWLIGFVARPKGGSGRWYRW